MKRVEMLTFTRFLIIGTQQSNTSGVEMTENITVSMMLEMM
jgi:hypothetical protein